MKEFAFDLQRFADESTLTADEKAAIQKSSLPHLRMISNIAKNPLVTGLVSTLENFKDGVGNISKDILPIYELVASFYKITRGNSGTAIKKKGDQDKVLRLLEDVEILKSSVEIIDSILDLVDGLSGVDTQKMIKEPGEIIREALSISNTVAKLKDASSDTIVLSLITTTLSYGLSVVSTLDGVTPEEQTEIRKAALRLGVESITSALEEMGHNLDNYTAPFGWVSAGISVGLAIIEGIYQYNDRIDYYSDDGLPEDIVRKEALIDAISGGLHEGLSNYLMGADDAIFNISKFLSEGCNWLAHALSSTLDNYQFTVSEMNYVEFIREIAKSGEYHSTSDADAITVSGNGISIYAQDGNDYIENYYSNVTILAGHGNDMISSYGGAKYNSIVGGNGNDNLFIINTISTIEGGKDDDFIFVRQGKNKIDGGAGNDSLSGGKGDDTLSGGKDNDTLTGGKGNDLFIYSAGNDVITDYAAGDKISIGAAIAKTSLKGSDAIFTIGKNTLTVTKGKNKELTFINAKGKEQKIIGGALLVTKNTTLESWRIVGDASTAAKAVQITGNDLANTILGGAKNDTLRGGKGNDYLAGNAGNDKLYGDAGNDTLRGGKGNDSLWGDKGADTFIYDSGDGQDIIYDFANNDLLQITGTFSGTYNKSKKEVYFKVGSTKNALTLKNFSATTFNVNGDDYHISGKKLVK